MLSPTRVVSGPLPQPHQRLLNAIQGWSYLNKGHVISSNVTMRMFQEEFLRSSRSIFEDYNDPEMLFNGLLTEDIQHPLQLCFQSTISEGSERQSCKCQPASSLAFGMPTRRAMLSLMFDPEGLQKSIDHACAQEQRLQCNHCKDFYVQRDVLRVAQPSDLLVVMVDKLAYFALIQGRRPPKVRKELSDIMAPMRGIFSFPTLDGGLVQYVIVAGMFPIFYQTHNNHNYFFRH